MDKTNSRESMSNGVPISVVLINFNGLEDTLECLESLRRTDGDFNEVIVVDNASAESQAEQIADSCPWVTVLASPENLGWSGGNNLGIQWSLDRAKVPTNVRVLRDASDSRASSVIFLLNNDTVVHPGVVKALTDATASDLSIFGPVINDYEDRSNIQTEGVLFNRFDRTEVFSTVRSADVPLSSSGCLDTDVVNGCAIAIKREVFEQIGLIDDRFFLIGEEADFCLRAGDAGFRLGVIPRSLVFHKHSVSFGRAVKPLQRYYGTRNLGLLLWRHSGRPGRRSRFGAIVFYLRHSYHLFCYERERRNVTGARAIAIGVADSMWRRYGSRPIAPGMTSRCLERLFSLVWRCRGGTPLNSVALATEDPA